MGAGKRWTRDELLIAMNLYMKLPFGQFYQGNRIVIALSQVMGRSPSSLAMKLSNLASLDPHHCQRGIKGLKGYSKLDQEVWQEFQRDWSSNLLKSEELFEEII